MQLSLDKIIIVRYLQKTASEEEMNLLEGWLVEDPSHKKEFDEVCSLWFASETISPYFTEKIKREWEILQKKIVESKNQPPIKPFSSPPELLKIAAIVILTIGLSWAAFYFFLTGKDTAGTLAEVKTPAGSITQIILPDSTHVWLNAESSLKYAPLTFGKKSREVYLSGEAYFDVTKQKRKKFIVNTSKIRVIVYGTRFNVKSYPEDATIETTLEKGKVIFSLIKTTNKASSKQVILSPGERAVFVKKQGGLLPSEIREENSETGREITVTSGNILVTRDVNTQIYTAWRMGRLIINNESLGRLVKKLQRRYDVQFIFKDNRSKKLRFTGTLEDETLEQVLYAIMLTAPITYKMDHKMVYIKSTHPK